MNFGLHFFWIRLHLAISTGISIISIIFPSNLAGLFVMSDQMEHAAVTKRNIEHDDTEEPPTKQQKLDSDETLKITDLKESCLMNIFSRLDLPSLLNVAMANKHLQVVAASTFGREFGEKTFCLQNVNKFHQPRISTLDDDIYVRGLALCLPFLRCFGTSITELRVLDGTYPHALIAKESRSKFSCHMDRYLNQYCAETLSTLLFYGRPAFSPENFRKPFRMVRKICLIDAALEDGLTKFANWFPNLVHLELNTVCIDGPLNAVALPVLEHLSLEINNSAGDQDHSDCLWNFNVQNAWEFLGQNRQLRSIKIDLPDRQTITIEKLLDLIERNPSVSKITMTEGSLYQDVNMDELERLVKRPLITEIDLPRHRFSVENVKFCVRHLKLLKKFRFQMTDWSEYDQLLRDFGSDWQIKQFHETIQLISINH